MTTLRTLKRQASKSATWRGHTLARWSHLHSSSATTTCKVCGAYVFVNTKPAPNQTDVAGNAVALNCPIGDQS